MARNWATKRDLFHADHTDHYVSAMNGDVDVIPFPTEFYVKLCEISVFGSVDLAAIVCKLGA